MDQNNDVFTNFKTALERRNLRKLLPIYHAKDATPIVNYVDVQYSPKDVLFNISKQLEAYQTADNPRKHSINNLKSYNKSKLVPVNLLSVTNTPQLYHTGINKFETQCVSDTQLINILENAEKIMMPSKGMTQEFENSFYEQNIVIEKDGRDNLNICLDNGDIESNFCYKDMNETPICELNIRKKNGDKHINIAVSDPVGIENTMNVSPVINYIKPLSLTNSSSPLVCTLDTFENFETLAFPIVEKNDDLEVAKHLINSHIVDKELCLGRFTKPVLNKLDRSPSPILSLKQRIYTPKSPKSISDKIKNVSFKVPDKKLVEKLSAPTDIKIDKNFEDEILFSSDEEDSKELNYKDLPLTCALETSFYNHQEVLDKTIYVGFQTASNKSIQISAESFSKAQSLLEDLDSSAFKPSVTELVQMCDAKVNHLDSNINCTNNNLKLSVSNTESSEVILKKREFDTVSTINLEKTNQYKQIKEVNTRKVKLEDVIESKVEDTVYLNKESRDNFSNSLGKLEKQAPNKSLSEFHTASNKKIKLSERALVTCQQVFKDIDVDNKFYETLPENIKRTYDNLNPLVTPNNIMKMYNNQKEVSEEIQLNDHNIIREFENELIDSDIERTKDDEINFKSIKGKNEGYNQAADTVTEKFRDNDQSQKHAKQTLAGFKTASNKQITISDNAFAKTKVIMKDISFSDSDNDVDAFKHDIDETSHHNVNEIMVQSKDISSQNNVRPFDGLQSVNLIMEKTEKFTSCGFKTASNVPVKISSEALEKSKKLFQEIETSVLNNVEELGKKRNTKFQGFKTANNQSIAISDTASSKAKNIFRDIYTGDDENNKIVPNDKKCDNLRDDFEKMPSVISENIANLNNETCLPENDVHSDSIKKSVPLTFEGFRTASNKKVEISDQALAKCRMLLQDFEFHKYDEHFQVQNKPVEEFKGFQTASDKRIKVSSQSLAKSKALFQDMDLNVKYEEINIYKENTGSGMTTFNDIEKDVKFRNSSQKKPGIDNINCKLDRSQNQLFVGFQTASNKQVKVSDRALALSKKLLQDFEFEEINKPNKINNGVVIKDGPIKSLKRSLDSPSSKHHIPNVLFKTANNKDVEFSQEALIKCKQIFDVNQNNRVVKLSQIIHEKSDVKGEEKIDTETLLDSEALNNFEVSMYTEDFRKDNKTDKSKRSGSPILSCPRPKKRKRFEVPCKNEITAVAHKRVGTESDRNTRAVLMFDENYKKLKKYALKDLRNMEKFNHIVNDVDPYIVNFNYDTVLQFQFNNERNELSEVAWTTKDLKKYFLSLINNKLVPDGWLDNHLKLIIFKLINYEKTFKNTLSGVCTAKNVLQQLKYRYDRELYNVQRPALRKLLEKDDVSTKTMILLVIEIYGDGVTIASGTGTSNVELLLSDGWYCIRACLDQMLVKLVRDKKISVGTKLAIHGAELLNCEQGLAPWEDTSRVRLKIFGNSTRRAHWDARLGHVGAGAILTPLSSVRPDGGKVSKLRALVTRVYPTLYVEKFDDGSTVTRSERLENLHQMKYESERQALLEKIYEEVEKEFTYQESQDSECDSQVRGGLDSGSQIHRLMRLSKDPGEFRANLTNSQCRLLQDYSSRRRERLLQAVQSRVEERLKAKSLHMGRNVVPVMKIRLADVSGSGAVFKAMMSVWRPNDAVQEIIKEGTWVDILNIIPTAVRFSEIQFSAGRQTIFNKSNYKESSKIQDIVSKLKRTCYHIRDLVKNPSMNTDCNEVDTAGLIFSIEPSNAQFESIKGQLFQNVYLTDAEKNIVCVNFWGGLKKIGYDNILDTGQVLACMNLQKRAGNSRKSIQQYRATEFSYFTKTPRIEEARKVVDDLNKILSRVNIKKFCEECSSKKNAFLMRKTANGENVSPYRINYSDYSLSRHKAFIDSPIAQKPSNLDDVFNLSGLDFESTFKQTDTQDMSPNTLLRKKKVNEKIARLKMYGEPPPITPIHILNKSDNAKSAFKNPLSSRNDISNDVARETKRQASCTTHLNSSPCFNSPAKRNSGKPVRLDFSDNPSKEDFSVNKIAVDPFAEEFDASPPLSLE